MLQMDYLKGSCTRRQVKWKAANKTSYFTLKFRSTWILCNGISFEGDSFMLLLQLKIKSLIADRPMKNKWPTAILIIGRDRAHL